MKFIMAMLILTQHTCNEWAHSTGLVHDFFGLEILQFLSSLLVQDSCFSQNYIHWMRKDKKIIIENGLLELERCIWSGLLFISASCLQDGIRKV